jgi:uncharacterized protein YgiM (DUF1202 family)
MLVIGAGAPSASAAREHLYMQVYVTEPYLELRTGPGRGYPVFHVVPREESVEILFRRTEWIKVRSEHGVEGWAAERDMLKTVLADGTPLTLSLGDRAGYTDHVFEAGVFAGEWGGASLVSAYTAFYFNSQLAAEGSIGQFLGRFSNGVVGDLGLTHVFAPEWRLSPFVMIGTGLVHTEPKVTLVAPTNRTEPMAYVGGGVRYYLTRRFFVRAEYKSHFVFTKLNQNEAADEWKMGFAFFY